MKPVSNRDLAVAIVREVRVHEKADPLQEIDPALLDNIANRIYENFVAHVEEAAAACERIAKLVDERGS